MVENFDNTTKGQPETTTEEIIEGTPLSETDAADLRRMQALVHELDIVRLSGEGGFDRRENAA